MTSKKRQKRLVRIKKARNMMRNNYSYRTEYKFEPLLDPIGKASGLPEDEELVVNKPLKNK